MASSQQFATYAPSKLDILGSLNQLLGQPAAPEKLADYTAHHAATYHFPDAYLGSNVTLRDTLNNLILNSPQEWQTNVGLPFTRIDGVTVEWDEIKFDVRLMNRVPYEGASSESPVVRNAAISCGRKRTCVRYASIACVEVRFIVAPDRRDADQH